MLNNPCVPGDEYSAIENVITLTTFVSLVCFVTYLLIGYNKLPINQEITQCYTTTCQMKTMVATPLSHHRRHHLLAAKC